MLIVDDDPAICNALKFSLELEGFSVRTFHDGLELLSASDLPGSGCLVLDYHMPKMDGREVLGRFRKQGNVMPAILITSAPDSSLRQWAGAAGVSVVEKPLLGDALIEAIRGKLHPAPPTG